MTKKDDKKIWIFERDPDTNTVYKREFLNYDEPRKKVRTLPKSKGTRGKDVQGL